MSYEHNSREDAVPPLESLRLPSLPRWLLLFQINLLLIVSALLVQLIVTIKVDASRVLRLPRKVVERIG